METDLTTQNRFYRRGLVLGLTMAEIAILVIFSLLLALGTLLGNKDEEIEQLVSEVEASTSAVEELRNKIREQAVIAGVNENLFDDFFDELTLKIQEASSYKDTIYLIEERSKQLTELEEVMQKYDAPGARQDAGEKTEWLETQLSIAQSVQEVVAGDSDSHEDLKQQQKRVEAELAALQQLQSEIQPPAPEEQSLADGLRRIVRANAELGEKNSNLQGQLRHIQRSLGKGTEHPSCWATRTGRPEYIFDTSLTDTGIIVTDNALPNRVGDQQKLPLQGMIFEQKLSHEVFLRTASPLYEWSKKEGCRFFVRVYDQTGPHEKSLYKTRLRIVESRFYTWEEPSSQQNVGDAKQSADSRPPAPSPDPSVAGSPPSPSLPAASQNVGDAKQSADSRLPAPSPDPSVAGSPPSPSLPAASRFGRDEVACRRARMHFYRALDTPSLPQKVQLYHQGLRLCPQSPRAHFELAEVYIRLGQPTRAAEELRTVLSYDPAYPGARQRLRSLQQR